MSDLNSQHNRVVWFDLPVLDLERACRFYEAVLGLPVHREAFGELRFGVLTHELGNGGCLVPGTPAPDPDTGVLVYLNAEGRLREAVAQVAARGGRVLEPIRSIGPHGYRAVVLDSEGNRVALHSQVDR
jgi:predicted enzyme related to lactoylglutathione lyase